LAVNSLHIIIQSGSADINDEFLGVNIKVIEFGQKCIVFLKKMIVHKFISVLLDKDREKVTTYSYGIFDSTDGFGRN
jgi:hypothetical protein